MTNAICDEQKSKGHNAYFSIHKDVNGKRFVRIVIEMFYEPNN